MPIGYRCLNSKAIARYIAEMLRASIMHTVTTINSYDLIQKFKDKELDPSYPTLLSSIDRNFINAHYHQECGGLTQLVARRRGEGEPMQLSEENIEYYENKLWPLGVVLYAVDEKLRTKDYAILKYAMTSIELSTCIVFEEYKDDQVLLPKSMLWFTEDGEDTPLYGFQDGNQTINLNKMATGAPGHTAHTINNLMRVLGVHMMSNRFDRDNYVTINWKNVVRGKEYLLEKAPQEAWLVRMGYDFDSATHAPANYVCEGCELGSTTVQPLQDHLWQKTMSMGHKTELSDADVQFLNMLYGKQCQNRFVSKK
ncbi:hatching enzyme 1.2-like [Epargyreus clarus]|uniref:hatching enzyme 1.2-like n=1 Tax=Epargyreus clarus TaxID=520877 RepID=UPI003C2F457E